MEPEEFRGLEVVDQISSYHLCRDGDRLVLYAGERAVDCEDNEDAADTFAALVEAYNRPRGGWRDRR